MLITGVPDYYPRLGFRRARDYGLTLKGGSAPDPFMAYELIPGYLAGGGVYDTWPEEYDRAEQDEAGFEAFDKAFEKKHMSRGIDAAPSVERDPSFLLTDGV